MAYIVKKQCLKLKNDEYTTMVYIINIYIFKAKGNVYKEAGFIIKRQY